MAYDLDFRLFVISKIESGMSYRKAASFFKISYHTVTQWVRKWRDENGDLSTKYPATRKARKLDKDKLIQYVEDNPDAYEHEIAAAFNCTQAAVHYRLKKLDITRKKNLPISRKMP